MFIVVIKFSQNFLTVNLNCLQLSTFVYTTLSAHKQVYLFTPICLYQRRFWQGPHGVSLPMNATRFCFLQILYQRISIFLQFFPLKFSSHFFQTWTISSNNFIIFFNFFFQHQAPLFPLALISSLYTKPTGC